MSTLSILKQINKQKKQINKWANEEIKIYLDDLGQVICALRASVFLNINVEGHTGLVFQSFPFYLLDICYKVMSLMTKF